MSVTLHLGDWLDNVRTLEAQSVNAILTDLPYGTTACKWDAVIPFAPMWTQVKLALNPAAANDLTEDEWEADWHAFWAPSGAPEAAPEPTQAPVKAAVK